MSEHEGNPSIFDAAHILPTRREFVGGATEEVLNPNGVHIITLFPETDPQHPSTIVYEPGSEIAFSNTLPTNSGSIVIAEIQRHGLISVTGVNEEGLILKATFLLPFSRLDEKDFSSLEPLAYSQEMEDGKAIRLLAPKEISRLKDIFKTGRLIQENKPYYSFSSLQRFASPLQSLGLQPGSS